MTKNDFLRLLDGWWRWILAGGCLIQHRDTQRIGPLVPNPMQWRAFETAYRQAQATGMLRLAVPKPRRHGNTALWSSLAVFLCMLNESYRARTIAHTGPDTLAIFDMAKRMAGEGVHETPVLVNDAQIKARAITWPNGAQHVPLTAGAMGGPGRGDTVHFLHFTELAYCQTTAGMDQAAINAVSNTVVDEPGTVIIYEGTGAGPTGEFHRICTEAIDPDSEFEVVFLAWFEDPGCTRTPPEDFAPTPDELALKAKHSLTDAQLYWYRVRSKRHANATDMRREYPSTMEDCFAAAGGRCHPAFEVARHVRALDSFDPGDGRWQLHRCGDWGWTSDMFVCLWAAHDPDAPAGFAVHPSCVDLVKEFLAFAKDPRTGQPQNLFKHGPDSVRYLVATLDLKGFLYVYRAYYMRDAVRLSAADHARAIHQLSGWRSELDPNDPGTYEPLDEGAEQFVGAAIFDRSQPRSIRDFCLLGIPTDGHERPPPYARMKGDVIDGIQMVNNLIVAGADYYAQPIAARDKLLNSAYATDAAGRALTLDQRDAIRADHGLAPQADPSEPDLDLSLSPFEGDPLDGTPFEG